MTVDAIELSDFKNHPNSLKIQISALLLKLIKAYPEIKTVLEECYSQCNTEKKTTQTLYTFAKIKDTLKNNEKMIKGDKEFFEGFIETLTNAIHTCLAFNAKSTGPRYSS